METLLLVNFSNHKKASLHLASWIPSNIRTANFSNVKFNCIQLPTKICTSLVYDLSILVRIYLLKISLSMIIQLCCIINYFHNSFISQRIYRQLPKWDFLYQLSMFKFQNIPQKSIQWEFCELFLAHAK